MGFPALVIPESWRLPASIPQVDPAALRLLDAEMRPLLDVVRRDRPAEGTTEETAALARFWHFGLVCLRLLGPTFIDFMRANLNQVLRDLLRKEIVEAEIERKLALRYVEQAIHTYGVSMESVGAALGGLPPQSLIALLDEAAERARSGEIQIGEDERIVLRFQLDVAVALDVLDAPLDELTFWATRAVADARRVEAMPAQTMSSGLRGEVARVRARRAWLAWDQAEVAKELAPWPDRSR